MSHLFPLQESPKAFNDVEEATCEAPLKKAECLNPIQTGLLSTFWDGPLCYFQTAYVMATKFAQYSVRANSNHYRYFDVTVT